MVKNEDMKRRLLLSALTFLVLTISLRAQDRRFVYMQVEIVYYGPGYRVVADLGTPSEKVLQFNYNYLKDDTDTPFCFNTKMAAVNWLAKDGWVLNDHCSRIDSTFIMKRDVSGMNETQVQVYGQLVDVEQLIRETPPIYGQTYHFESTFYCNRFMVVSRKTEQPGIDTTSESADS